MGARREDSAKGLGTLLVDVSHPQGHLALHHPRNQKRERGMMLLRRGPDDVPDLLQDLLRRVEVDPGQGHELLCGGVLLPWLDELSLDLLHLATQEVDLVSNQSSR